MTTVYIQGLENTRAKNYTKLRRNRTENQCCGTGPVLFFLYEISSFSGTSFAAESNVREKFHEILRNKCSDEKFRDHRTKYYD